MHPSQAYKVPKKSAKKIVDIALNLRSKLGLNKASGIKAHIFVELLNGLYALEGRAAFDIREASEMAEMGMFDPALDLVKLREDVYDAACEGCIESLYTIVHECGHMQLHGGATFCRLERLTPEQIYSLDPDEHSEEQADLFACAVKLHPERLRSLVNKRIPLISISEVYKIPGYQLERYMDRLVEECGYKIDRSLRNQMALSF